MTIDKILNANYYDVFTENEDGINHTFRDLVKVFHPDVCKDDRANDAIARLSLLHKEALEHLHNHTWKEANVLTLKRSDGKVATIKNYKFQSVNEMGRYWVSDSLVCYEFLDTKEKYFNNYIKRVSDMKFANKEMEEHFRQFIPNILDSFKSEDGKFYIVLKKEKNVYPLSLLKDIFSNGVHAAWLTTKTLDLCNLFQYNGIVHNGITVDNCFVNLELHAVYIYGGWQYATKIDEKMLGVPRSVYSIMKDTTKEGKVSKTSTDLDSAKEMVKDAANCKSYVQLSVKFPEPFASYLCTSSGEDATDVYYKWEKARAASWDKRVFVKVDTPKDIYENTN